MPFEFDPEKSAVNKAKHGSPSVFELGSADTDDIAGFLVEQARQLLGACVQVRARWDAFDRLSF